MVMGIMSDMAAKLGFTLWPAAFAIVYSLGIMFPASAGEQNIDAQARVSDAQPDASGFLVHEISSPFQSGKTSVRVLLPDERKTGQRFFVIYVLPVEARAESRY